MNIETNQTWDIKTPLSRTAVEELTDVATKIFGQEISYMLYLDLSGSDISVVQFEGKGIDFDLTAFTNGDGLLYFEISTGIQENDMPFRLGADGCWEDDIVPERGELFKEFWEKAQAFKSTPAL